MKRNLAYLGGVALGLILLVSALHWLGSPAPLSPFPDPKSPDPSGTLAYPMLLHKRAVPFELSGGPPPRERRLMLFAKSPFKYSKEEELAAVEWVRGGGHLVLVYAGDDSAGFPQIEERFGFGFFPATVADPVEVKALPFAGVSMRPGHFSLLIPEIKIKGSTGDDQPCWIWGRQGLGSWEAVADAHPLENSGLDEGGNALFALSLAGEGVRVDETLFRRGEKGGTLGQEPLFWGAFIQFALLGGLLLFQFRRLGAPIPPHAPVGSLRLRSSVAKTLSKPSRLVELVEIEGEMASLPAGERVKLVEAAARGEWKGAYLRVRAKEKEERR